MKKKIIAAVILIFSLFPSSSFAAININVNNYYYVHANKPGTYSFKLKSGQTTMRGDFIEDDAYILSFDFLMQGVEATDRVFAVIGGQEYTISGNNFQVPVQAKSLTLKLNKQSTNETYVRIINMITDDAAATSDVFYNFKQLPPSKHGDLGNGSGGGTTPPTPIDLNAMHTAIPDANGWIYIGWNRDALPSGNKYEILYDGVLQYSGTLTAGANIQVAPPNDGQLVEVIEKKNGTIFGYYANVYPWRSQISQPTHTTDGGDDPPPGDDDPPGPGDPTPGDDDCEPCGWIREIMSCPGWGEYMGEWENMLRDVIPPPPNWYQVAGIMRDTIVPAMGQELINRAPELADIIADEFESREKPVSPPPALIPFDPDVPQMIDLPSTIDFDLSSDIPSFEPDFSGSGPFVIPGIDSIDFDDHSDKGYDYPDTGELDQSAPAYDLEIPDTPQDPGYNKTVGEIEEPPEYTPPDPGEPEERYYEIKNGDGVTRIPIYKPRTDPPPPNQEYEKSPLPMPDYEYRKKGGGED